MDYMTIGLELGLLCAGVFLSGVGIGYIMHHRELTKQVNRLTDAELDAFVKMLYARHKVKI